jgi:hypothetical protein
MKAGSYARLPLRSIGIERSDAPFSDKCHEDKLCRAYSVFACEPDSGGGPVSVCIGVLTCATWLHVKYDDSHAYRITSMLILLRINRKSAIPAIEILLKPKVYSSFR